MQRPAIRTWLGPGRLLACALTMEHRLALERISLDAVLLSNSSDWGLARSFMLAVKIAVSERGFEMLTR